MASHYYTVAGRFARALLLGDVEALTSADLEALDAFTDKVPPRFGWIQTDGANGWCMDDCVTIAAIQVS